MAFLFMCIIIFFLCHFLSLTLNKCLLTRIQEKTLIFAKKGRGGSNHSEVIIKVTYC